MDLIGILLVTPMILVVVGFLVVPSLIAEVNFRKVWVVIPEDEKK